MSVIESFIDKTKDIDIDNNSLKRLNSFYSIITYIKIQKRKNESIDNNLFIDYQKYLSNLVSKEIENSNDIKLLFFISNTIEDFCDFIPEEHKKYFITIIFNIFEIVINHYIIQHKEIFEIIPLVKSKNNLQSEYVDIIIKYINKIKNKAFNELTSSLYNIFICKFYEKYFKKYSTLNLSSKQNLIDLIILREYLINNEKDLIAKKQIKKYTEKVEEIIINSLRIL